LKVHIPFFGMTGAYDSAPGIYSSTGAGAAEASNAIGLFYWVWFGITASRESIKYYPKLDFRLLNRRNHQSFYHLSVVAVL